jgi:transcriptional regulator with XRE-family HTH domain
VFLVYLRRPPRFRLPPVPQRRGLQGELDTPLARARASKGVYQRELAEAVGISIASYRRLERGPVGNAPLWQYTNCAIALNVELEQLLGRKALTSWHPTPSAPRPPNEHFLADRYERALAWREELPEE